MSFNKAIKLNEQQQKAVQLIDGPLLVIAGPGTGKTQLLSARIANILEKTDALPQNILCLTFTEAASHNMRQRLTEIIKDEAYDVHINTYHGFGSDIIRSYPEFFEEIDLQTGKDSRLERPIDDLQRIQIVSEIINSLPYSSPLFGARRYIKNVVSTISELKRALYSPETLANLAKKNLDQVKAVSPKIAEILVGVKNFPTKAEKSIQLFEPIAEVLDGLDGIANSARNDLLTSIEQAENTNKSKPLTAWKNKWLTKDSSDRFQFTDPEQHLRILELAKVFEKYQKVLENQQLYDFDDMILKTIHALKTKKELKFNLQEKYQYILLDEFQDTNSAQFELVKILGDNPVNEGRPNIFAVGDDDQAIYAFQGAEVSNMIGFINAFRDVAVINLTENYRSHPEILHVAHNIAQQIESRLHNNLEGIEKVLSASSKKLPKDATIDRHEFDGEANELAWVANQVSSLINSKVPASEIAILAPKHSMLEKILPFLSQKKIPVSYEKREDILQTPLLKTYQMMSRLLLALNQNNTSVADELFPKILSLDFFEIPVEEIWKTNWTHSKWEETRSWAEIALENPLLKEVVIFYLKLGLVADSEPLESILDYLTGSVALEIEKNLSYVSPLKSFYFNESKQNSLRYYESLANLSTIREHIRAYQVGHESLLTIKDFVEFIQAYEIAEQPLINTHPIAQAEESVQLMTVYKAKGLEFEHVFLLSVHDDLWGKKARGNSNKLTLPDNLKNIRYRGSDEDELKRLMFVAITRAKHGLYLTSYATKDTGKATEPVKYLLEFYEEDIRKSSVLPSGKQLISKTPFTPDETMLNIELLWESRHLNLETSLKYLLKERLDRYQMSPTHVNSFVDIEYGGPEKFLLYTLLRFPQAPGEAGEFGNAVHGTLDWYQKQIHKKISISSSEYLKEFDKQLAKKYIANDRKSEFKEKGHTILTGFINHRKEMMAIPAITEVDFRNEGVVISGAHLTGKIDRLEVDEKKRTINIVDFKTGQPYKKWEKTTKLLKYEQQLYYYKFLIEGSTTFRGYSVESARLEFVEPTASGEIVPPLYVDFDVDREEENKKLILVIWKLIHDLKLPDISDFPPNYHGMLKFIKNLIG